MIWFWEHYVPLSCSYTVLINKLQFIFLSVDDPISLYYWYLTFKNKHICLHMGRIQWGGWMYRDVCWCYNLLLLFFKKNYYVFIYFGKSSHNVSSSHNFSWNLTKSFCGGHSVAHWPSGREGCFFSSDKTVSVFYSAGREASMC